MSAASSSQCPHAARSTYVVIPTTGLATLEHPLALVAGHSLVEEPLLGARIGEVVVHHVVAEERTRDGSLFEPGDRVAQGMWKPLDVGLVGIALERRPELEPVLDTVEPCREQRGEGEVRIRVGSRDARLGA